MRTMPSDSIPMEPINGSASHTSSRLLTGLIVGAAVGAAVALLFAPTTGQKFRRQLWDGAGKLGGHAKDLYSSASSYVGKAREQATDAADEVRRRTTVNS